MHLGAYLYASTNELEVRELRAADDPTLYLVDATIGVTLYQAVGNSPVPGGALAGTTWPISVPYFGPPGVYRAILPASITTTRGQRLKIEVRVQHGARDVRWLFDAEVK